MLPTTYILKEEVQVPGSGYKGPADDDAGYRAGREFIAVHFVLDDSCVLVL